MYIIKITICLPSFSYHEKKYFSTASLSINVLLAVFECVDILIPSLNRLEIHCDNKFIIKVK